MFPKLKLSIEALDTIEVLETRKPLLRQIAHYIKEHLDAGQACKLNFICTHNSRRSVLAQVWAQALAEYYKVPGLQSFSGGTEATAVYPQILEALKHSGFEFLGISDLGNSIHPIKYTKTKSIKAFSKIHSHKANPQNAFAAVMVCSHADEHCPFIPGAEARFSLPYLDPKLSDGTVEEEKTYLKRSLEIARELKFVFERVV